MIREGFILPSDSQLTVRLRGEEMSPFFMDAGYKPSSPGSLSAEESHSNAAGSEKEGESQQRGGRGTKRKETNREAARKSRRKQTERADELHQELQSLEQSNSVLQKEITSLRRDFQLYRTALERHEPSCCLRDAASSSGSTTNVPVSSTADCQASSSPPAATSPTSLTSSLSLQTVDCVESASPSSSAPAPPTATLASSPGSSPDVFTSSSSLNVPCSALAPHPLFSDDPPLITSRPTNVTPICGSALTIAAEVKQSRKRAIHECCSTPANAFSTLDALDTFLTKQASSVMAPSNVVPLYSHFVGENTDTEVQGCAMNVPQLRPGHFRGKPINSSCILPSALQDPALQSLPVYPQAKPEPCPASVFAPRPSYSQHIAPSPTSLLSLLTVPPSPFNGSQITSSLDGPQAVGHQTGDTSKDLSLSEFLEINDWLWTQ